MPWSQSSFGLGRYAGPSVLLGLISTFPRGPLDAVLLVDEADAASNAVVLSRVKKMTATGASHLSLAARAVGHPNRGSVSGWAPGEGSKKSNSIAVSPSPLLRSAKMWTSFGLPRRARLPDSSRYPIYPPFARSAPRLPFASCLLPSIGMPSRPSCISNKSDFSARLGRSPPSQAVLPTDARPAYHCVAPSSLPSDPEDQGHPTP